MSLQDPWENHVVAFPPTLSSGQIECLLSGVSNAAEVTVTYVHGLGHRDLCQFIEPFLNLMQPKLHTCHTIPILYSPLL